MKRDKRAELARQLRNKQNGKGKNGNGALGPQNVRWTWAHHIF